MSKTEGRNPFGLDFYIFVVYPYSVNEVKNYFELFDGVHILRNKVL